MNDFIDQFSIRIIEAAPDIVTGVIVFLGFWIVSKVVVGVFAHFIGLADEDKKDILKLLSNIVRYALLTFGAVAGLGTMGIDVSALVAGLGLTGFALGFALRDAISNLISGALILIYRPFRRNDHIEVSGKEGKVIAIDLRYTTLEDETRRILIPNATLFSNTVTVRKGEGGE